MVTERSGRNGRLRRRGFQNFILYHKNEKFLESPLILFHERKYDVVARLAASRNHRTIGDQWPSSGSIAGPTKEGLSGAKISRRRTFLPRSSGQRPFARPNKAAAAAAWKSGKAPSWFTPRNRFQPRVDDLMPEAVSSQSA